MIRLLLFLVTGLCCLIGGIIIGVSSYQVAYRHTGSAIVAHFLSGGSASSKRLGYLQMVGNDTLYLINEDDFSPRYKIPALGMGIVFPSSTDR